MELFHIPHKEHIRCDLLLQDVLISLGTIPLLPPGPPGKIAHARRIKNWLPNNSQPGNQIHIYAGA